MERPQHSAIVKLDISKKCEHMNLHCLAPDSTRQVERQIPTLSGTIPHKSVSIKDASESKTGKHFPCIESILPE